MGKSESGKLLRDHLRRGHVELERMFRGCRRSPFTWNSGRPSLSRFVRSRESTHGFGDQHALTETVIGLFKTEVIRPRGRGAGSRPSSSLPSSGWTGPITGASSSPSATSHPPRLRPASTPNWRPTPWRRRTKRTSLRGNPVRFTLRRCVPLIAAWGACKEPQIPAHTKSDSRGDSPEAIVVISPLKTSEVFHVAAGVATVTGLRARIEYRSEALSPAAA